MKTVFCIIPMQAKFAAKYKAHKAIDGGREVVYPINSVLSKTMRAGDKLKVVLLKAINPNDSAKIVDKNEQLFIDELNAINKDIGAEIVYDKVEINFTEERKEQEKMFKGILDRCTHNMEVYADITYGPKSIPIILFAALNFAEKFYNADIKHLIYGKAYFDETGKPYGHEIVDMTSLYLLNGITNNLYDTDAEGAKRLVDRLFETD